MVQVHVGIMPKAVSVRTALGELQCVEPPMDSLDLYSYTCISIYMYLRRIIHIQRCQHCTKNITAYIMHHILLSLQRLVMSLPFSQVNCLTTWNMHWYGTSRCVFHVEVPSGYGVFGNFIQPMTGFLTLGVAGTT